MNRFRVEIVSLIALLALGGAALACGWLLPSQEPVAIWTPAPLSTGDLATQPAILPTATPRVGTAAVLATSTSSKTPAPTASPPAGPTATPAPASAPTTGAQLVVITEADVARAIASGATAQSGLTVEGLAVRFSDDKMQVTADRLSYGIVQIQDLALVGRLVARDGVVHLETESISPTGLVTALIPALADQVLQQFGAQWYVEEIYILDGHIELKVR